MASYEIELPSTEIVVRGEADLVDVLQILERVAFYEHDWKAKKSYLSSQGLRFKTTTAADRVPMTKEAAEMVEKAKKEEPPCEED